MVGVKFTKIDLTGQRFGHLIVIKEAGLNRHRNWKWLCKCDCGVEKIISSNRLRSGQLTCGGCGKIKYNMLGKKYGRLLVIGEGEPAMFFSKTQDRMYKHRRLICLCDCGKQTLTFAPGLRNGKTQSCGCLSLEKRVAARKTHGMSGTTEHRIWMSIRQRCNNPGYKRYCDYGGRGIGVCGEWDCIGGFEKFYAYVGPRPSQRHSLDRIDVNGNYEPGNVRWATWEVQASNRRKMVRIEQWDTQELMAELARRQA